MCQDGSVFSTHSDVEDGDHIEGRGEDGAHAFDGRLVQAVVGRQHLPVRDKEPNDNTICALRDTRKNWCGCIRVLSGLSETLLLLWEVALPRLNKFHKCARISRITT